MKAWVHPPYLRGIDAAHSNPARRSAAILRFAVVSGVGLAGDMVIFALLIRAGVPVLHANAISATCAVSFVFFAAVHRVFHAGGSGFLFGKFLAYLAYQAIAIWLASLAVAWLAPRLALPERVLGALPATIARHASVLPGLCAKLLILPATFYANFVFMAKLTTGRWRWL